MMGDRDVMLNSIPRTCYIGTMVCLSVLFYSGTSHAFETKRQGLFLGLGIEPGILNTQYLINEFDDERNYDVYALACNFNLRVGYGLSDKSLIYLSSHLSLSGLYGIDISSRDLDSVDGIGIDSTIGVGTAYYMTRRFYIEGNLGLAGLTVLYDDYRDFDDFLVGIGVSGGIGYHIHPNVSIEVTLDYSRFPDTFQGCGYSQPFSYDYDYFSYGYVCKDYEAIFEIINLSLSFNLLIW